jgi:murein DD-endopeptidase MepM/ murein hydrolase activator NlpD
MNTKILSLNFLFTAVLIFGTTSAVFARTTFLTISPQQIIQGEPLLVQINGTTGTSTIKKIIFDKKSVGIFLYRDKPSALIGIDLNKKPGQYELFVELTNGQILKETITVGKREKIEAPLSIPAKLGGDTKASQEKLISTLADENKSLASARTGAKAFWTEAFVQPLKEIFITDEYGYSRKTGAYSIPHKGVDYRATEGTPVTAMNRGVVRIAKTYRNYGKTVVVDHGLGLMTFYMHLSKINVNAGELVKPGQLIGLSGQTGYAETSHLHLTVRINGSSIDPVKFATLFQ